MHWNHHAVQARQIWHNERGSLLVQKAGLAMATAVLILGLAVMFSTRGGEIGNSLVQVFTCQLGRFGGGSAGCGAPAATTPGGGGGGAPATNPGTGTQAGNPGGNPFANFSFWDWAQLALDLFGFIPGVGEIADFINAIISAIRGDWAGAALSLAAMWPAGGQAATIAKISAKYGDEVAAVFRNLDDIIAGRRSADEVAGGARRLPCVGFGVPLLPVAAVASPLFQPVVLGPLASSGSCVFTSSGAGTHLRRTTTVDGTTFQFNTGHAYNRPHTGPGGVVTDLRTSGLTPDDIEPAIINDIDAFRSAGNTLPTAGSGVVTRSVNINGVNVEYRVSQLPDGRVSITTYYQVP
ncbi:MAG: hypothetical protein MUD01_14140 [Chloroflexaceae bacterium]|jgi:hypothetical protein|nr:hypothetical protein [Chloroflexaceae bacterium]